MRSVFSEFYLVCTIVNNLSILCIVFFLVRGYFYQKVNLSVGSFKIRKKDFSVQNITNIVSMKFYNGGEIPANIRKEILIVTCPDVKNLVRNDVIFKKNKRKKHYRKPRQNDGNVSQNK